MPILIDKDARINLLFPNSLFRFSPRRSELKALHLKQLLRDVSVGIVTLKERTLSPTGQLFNERCQELAKQLPR